MYASGPLQTMQAGTIGGPFRYSGTASIFEV